MKIVNKNVTCNIGSNAGFTTEEAPELPQISIKGDNNKGIITVNTGDNPGGELIARINFTESFGSDNLLVEILAVNRQAKRSGIDATAEAIEGSGFELNCTQQLDANDVYQWSYEVTEILSSPDPTAFRNRIEVLPNGDGKFKVELQDNEWATHLVLAPYTPQESVSVGRDFTGGEIEDGDIDILPHADYPVKKDSENNFLKYQIPLGAVNGSFFVNGITGTCYVFVFVQQKIIS